MTGRQHQQNHAPSQSALRRPWRSRGWKPLAYPIDALGVTTLGTGSSSLPAGNTQLPPTNEGDDGNNRWFPLHRSVLMATVRELLLLDGTLQSQNLRINPSKVLVRQNNMTMTSCSDSGMNISTCQESWQPRYRLHQEPGLYQSIVPAMTSTPSSRTKRKRLPESNQDDRKQISDQVGGPSKKANLVVSSSASTSIVTPTLVPVMVESEGESPTMQPEVAPDAEQLVHTILERTAKCWYEDRCHRIHHGHDPQAPQSTHSVAPGDAIASTAIVSTHYPVDSMPAADTTSSDRPRKVSDSDSWAALSSYSNLLTDAIALPSQDISRFVHLHERGEAGALIWKQELPHLDPTGRPLLVEASISTEETLRSQAYDMVKALVQTFQQDALLVFLGVNPTSYDWPRSLLIQIIADILFDTSHALFAWQQTETEFIREKPKSGASSLKQDEHELLIRQSLFDARTLRKLGGWEPSTLFCQALSVERLSDKAAATSWEDFALTPQGQAMFQHHAKPGLRLLVGQRRRGQRLRQYQQRQHCEVACDEWTRQRERSESFASCDTDDTTCSPHSSLATDVSSCTALWADIPSSIEVQLVRSPGQPWGVLLSREGNMCVVVRAGQHVDQASIRDQDDDHHHQHHQQLLTGDLIMQVRNEDGQVIKAPSFGTATDTLPVLSLTTPTTAESWFHQMVALFKDSNALAITVQRVGGTSCS